MDLAHRGDLLLRQTAEVVQFDHPSLPLIELRELHERIIQRDEFPGSIGRDSRLVQLQGVLPRPAFVGASLARMVHKDLAHVSRCDGKEVSSIGEIKLRAPRKSKIHLGDQVCRAERVPRPLAS